MDDRRPLMHIFWLLQQQNGLNLVMPLHRNFTYWIDKRKWKYVFLLTTLELSVG